MFILADRVRFQEIITNLPTTALKFTLQGGRVWLEQSFAAPNVISFSIADTGVGIAPADPAAIFDRFRHVGPATSGVCKGTGLGLAIVTRLVEMHGRTITVIRRRQTAAYLPSRFPVIRRSGESNPLC